MAYTFDGANKRIRLSAGTTSLELSDLYSRWKDWVLADNGGYLPAFSTVGGDIPSIPLYCFLENGWRIVPQAADHALNVTGGILEVRGGGEPFVDPAGNYKIRITRQTPGIAIGYSTTSGGSSSSVNVDDIAQAVRAILSPDLDEILVAAQTKSSSAPAPKPVVGISPAPVAIVPARTPVVPKQGAMPPAPGPVKVVPSGTPQQPSTQTSSGSAGKVVVVK